MAEFTINYTDPQGKSRKESHQAASAQELRLQFNTRGLIVHSVRPANQANSGQQEVLKGRLDLEQFIIFNEQFLALIRAGLSIPRSLELLANNTRNKILASRITAIHGDIKDGIHLSEAFAMRGGFPPIYITSLLAGERSGSLDVVLERYIHYQKLSLAIRKRIKLSLIYPAVLLFIVIVLVVFLVTFVVPEFAQLYDTMDASLPRSTQLLVAFGVTAQEHFFLLLTALVLLVSTLIWTLRSKSTKTLLERIILYTPVFGQIWIRYHVAQLSRLLGTLLTGGLPLVSALETAGDSMGSGLLRNALKSTVTQVKEGQSLSASLLATGIIPSLAIEMVQVGETTGALSQMLSSLAEFFDDEVQTKTSALLNLIEPAILIFMGIFVAFVLISLYLPIFSLAERI